MCGGRWAVKSLGVPIFACMVTWMMGFASGLLCHTPGPPLTRVLVALPAEAQCWQEPGKDWLICYPEEAP